MKVTVNEIQAARLVRNQAITGFSPDKQVEVALKKFFRGMDKFTAITEHSD